MALNQSQIQIRVNVRKFANVQGTTALLRHPDTDLNDYINRALGSLHRRLSQAIPDQRFLSSTNIDTEDGVSVYALPSNFESLISVDLTVDSHRSWLNAYEMSERPSLTSADEGFSGVPLCYRLRGGNIEYLPTPRDEFTSVLWYVPSATQFTADAQTFDTVSRLDDYLVAYASRLIAIKDKNWDLRDACSQVLGEFESEIDVIARSRDKNSPPRIVDVYSTNKWGRSRRCR